MSLRAFILGLAVVAATMTGPPLQAQAPDRMKIVAAQETTEVSGAAKKFDQVAPLMLDPLGKAFSQRAPGNDRAVPAPTVS